jgi:TonB family protein
VIVALRLDAEGRVEDATVERSSGYEILDREALLAASKSRFRLPPGLKPPVRGRIQYRFELTD